MSSVSDARAGGSPTDDSADDGVLINVGATDHLRTGRSCFCSKHEEFLRGTTMADPFSVAL